MSNFFAVSAKAHRTICHVVFFYQLGTLNCDVRFSNESSKQFLPKLFKRSLKDFYTCENVSKKSFSSFPRARFNIERLSFLSVLSIIIRFSLGLDRCCFFIFEPQVFLTSFVLRCFSLVSRFSECLVHYPSDSRIQLLVVSGCCLSIGLNRYSILIFYNRR